MYYEDQSLSEIHFMKHRHDDLNTKDYVDYEKKILTNSLSSYLFNNNLVYNFILKLQRPVSILFDNVNVVKNFKNYIVDKYHYKHTN